MRITTIRDFVDGKADLQFGSYGIPERVQPKKLEAKRLNENWSDPKDTEVEKTSVKAGGPGSGPRPGVGQGARPGYRNKEEEEADRPGHPHEDSTEDEDSTGPVSKPGEMGDRLWKRGSIL
jgi:hypothetical protein